MAMFTLAFTLLAAFAVCGHRAVFGPQRQLAAVALGLGAVGTGLGGLAYPSAASPLLWAGCAGVVGMLAVAAVMAGTSLLYWLRTPDLPPG